MLLERAQHLTGLELRARSRSGAPFKLHEMHALLSIPLPVVIGLILIVWLLLMGVIATACHAAARGDHPDRRLDSAA